MRFIEKGLNTCDNASDKVPAENLLIGALEYYSINGNKIP
jgi:hypothetical protein